MLSPVRSRTRVRFPPPPPLAQRSRFRSRSIETLSVGRLFLSCAPRLGEGLHRPLKVAELVVPVDRGRGRESLCPSACTLRQGRPHAGGRSRTYALRDACSSRSSSRSRQGPPH